MSLRLSGGRRLQSPPGATARPTAARVRLAVMNLLAADLPGCRWLDLCCGSGLMGCEALQRGARTVLAVERDRRIAAVARANLLAVAQGRAAATAGQEQSPVQVAVVQQEVLRFLASRNVSVPPIGSVRPGGTGRAEASNPSPIGEFNLIYVDPPYGAGLHVPVATAVAAAGWLAPQGTLIWECGSTALPDLPSGWHLNDQRRYGSTTVMLLSQG